MNWRKSPPRVREIPKKSACDRQENSVADFKVRRGLFRIRFAQADCPPRNYAKKFRQNFYRQVRRGLCLYLYPPWTSSALDPNPNPNSYMTIPRRSGEVKRL